MLSDKVSRMTDDEALTEVRKVAVTLYETYPELYGKLMTSVERIGNSLQVMDILKKKNVAIWELVRSETVTEYNWFYVPEDRFVLEKEEFDLLKGYFKK